MSLAPHALDLRSALPSDRSCWGHPTLALTLLAVILSACGSADRAIAPAPDVVALASNGTKQSLTDAFVNAQGTYCDAATPGDCEFIAEWDIGYIPTACASACTLAVTTDFAGVNARWWVRRGLPGFPAYYHTGAVSETRLADGRRRIIANIRGHNTFVAFYDAPGLDGVVLGADFFEYPIFSPAARTPMLGEASVAAELIIPADFVGMPDVAQLLYFPAAGMEIRRLDATVTARGRLRKAYDGIPAGTLVDVHGVSRSMPKLGVIGVKSRRLIEMGYDPTSRITVKRVAGE